MSTTIISSLATLHSLTKKPDSPNMLLDTIVTGLLMAASAAAIPIENPMELIKRAPSAGVVIQKCAKPGVFALAYDDGPYQYTSQLVDILNNGGAKATFFMTGTLYGCIYNQRTAVKKAFDSGHQIASHTWTHPSTFGSLTTAQLTTEMQKLEQAMVNIIGKKPAYMRPPYLATGGSVLSTMKTLGYKVITDDVDSGDWNGQTPAQSEAKFTAAGASGNGHIPLMHETYATTVQTLTPWLINWAKQNNLKLVTVAECLDDASGAYQSGSFTGNGATTC
ncbi:polysaccharide deacetylase [Colletotrichum scovillei]|nr:polysaccharide deacetylase [Colletotrichum scovillei]KAF4773051.1 polysaccharide deacetylase [Colletotrichum scovillei]